MNGFLLRDIDERNISRARIARYRRLTIGRHGYLMGTRASRNVPKSFFVHGIDDCHIVGPKVGDERQSAVRTEGHMVGAFISWDCGDQLAPSLRWLDL